MARVIEHQKELAGVFRRANTSVEKKVRSSSKDDGKKGREPEVPQPRKKVRWGAAGLLTLGALLVVLFVYNSIAVNELLGSITSIEAERDNVQRENERLQAELLRLMSVERVTSRAEAFGLVLPKTPPEALPMDNR